MDFQRPLDPPQVVAVDSRGRRRINALQLSVQDLQSFGHGPPAKLGTELRIGRRPLEDARVPALEIQQRAADGDDRPAATMNLLDRVVRQFDEPCRAEALPRVGHVQQVVRDGRTLRRGRLGRADVHPAVDLHRVHADDLCPDRPGQRAAERPLARRRAADNGDDPVLHANLPSSVRSYLLTGRTRAAII